MSDLLHAALPEFLGSLGAALTVALGAWSARALRTRRTRPGAVPPPRRREEHGDTGGDQQSA
ncbi:hypothetical protein DMH15_02910 [Streptomyces sp. WAC 06725]|uniref:hypothetical protein n=1 Tax=Streptomyces sp. WAC 06725 TaxID=2203209 RepID=UPI0010003851|nr:hypothetical protein [Streptomyces sp. WAC 06725]RSO49635.1 hypothetical protein DMH15_02910 [Streptomyces sp. WAC 06725]